MSVVANGLRTFAVPEAVVARVEYGPKGLPADVLLPWCWWCWCWWKVAMGEVEKDKLRPTRCASSSASAPPGIAMPEDMVGGGLLAGRVGGYGWMAGYPIGRVMGGIIDRGEEWNDMW